MRWFVKAVAAAIGMGLGCHAVLASTATIEQADYAVAHARIDVGAGRHLNLFCAGAGKPTVVFDAGAGLAGWDWLLVHPAIAARTRACVYDRAGLGLSDPASRPSTSANAVDDLHRLLHAAGVAPPYVLVGHSYGGANVQLYTYTYPQEVAGLVLVDASHEDEEARLDRITEGKFSQLMAQQDVEGQKCLAAAHAGLARGTPAYEQCVGEAPPMFGPVLAAAYVEQEVSANYWDAAASEVSNQVVSDAQLRLARRAFGALPLIYLTHGISPYLVPGQPQSEMNKASERDVVAQHEAVARLSSRGRQRVVAGAAHSIHIDRPQAVIDAVLEVLAQARKPGRR